MSYSVIAIEREYASGGSEIGRKLGDKLGIPCYGEEILTRAADKIGLSVRELRDLEETMTGSFLYGIHMLSRLSGGENNTLTKAQRLSIAEAEVIREMAYSPCVIVGRCAPAILKEEEYVLKAFVHTDWEMRKQRAIERYHHEPEQAETMLRRFDRKRSNYFKANAGRDWKDEKNYHLMLDGGKLGIDAVVDILYGAARR